MGNFLFKHRDKTGIPLFIIMLFFSKPTFKTLMFSLPLLFAAEALRIISLMYVGKSTRAREIKAPFLATGGPYAYVRNPIYIGNLFIGLAFMILFNPKLIFYLIFVTLFFLQYTLIIVEEENFLRNEFGEAFLSYKKKIRRFIPSLKPYPERTTRKYSLKDVLKFERSTIYLIIFILILGVLMIFLQRGIRD